MVYNNQNNENSTRAPDFKGDGISVWVAQKQNGEKYLRIRVLDSISLTAWKYVPKQVVSGDLI